MEPPLWGGGKTKNKNGLQALFWEKKKPAVKNKPWPKEPQNKEKPTKFLNSGGNERPRFFSKKTVGFLFWHGFKKLKNGVSWAPQWFPK